MERVLHPVYCGCSQNLFTVAGRTLCCERDMKRCFKDFWQGLKPFAKICSVFAWKIWDPILACKNTTGLKGTGGILTLVIHNAFIYSELSMNPLNPFITKVIAEFNYQRSCLSNDMATNSTNLKCEALKTAKTNIVTEKLLILLPFVSLSLSFSLSKCYCVSHLTLQ